MGARMRMFLLVFILFLLWFINYKYNNIIVRMYNQTSKIPKFLIIGLSIVALLSPALLKNNLFLEYFKTYLPENVNQKIDEYQEKKEIINQIKPKKQKRNVSEQTKKYVASNQNWRCKNCNVILDASYEVDHIIPLYLGGSNDIKNLRALCRNCHGKKTLEDNMKRKNII